MSKWINKNKQLCIPILLLIAAVVLSVSTTSNGGDFDIFLEAARKLKLGQNIYAPPFIRGLQYYYSVFFALILIPFSNYVFLSEIIWSLLSFVLLYRTLIIIREYFDFSFLSPKQYNVWLILVFILSIQFILYNVSAIQITMFLLWTIFESIHLLGRRKYIVAGVLLGLAINIKIMPIIMLAYLFYRGYFKTLLSVIITFVVLLYLPSLFIGEALNDQLLSEWWRIINPLNKEHVFETERTQSLISLLSVLLTYTTAELPYKRNIANLELRSIELVANSIRFLILALSLFFLRTLPFKREGNKLKTIWEISYFVMIIPLLLPHQQKYAFLLVIPMVSYLVYFFICTYGQQEKPAGYFIVLFFFGLCMLFYSPIYGSDVIGSFLFQLTQHYRLLTWATLLLIPISIYCSPYKIELLKSRD